MGDITIQEWDATGNKRIDVEAPDDVTVDGILVVLTDRLHLPEPSPDGQLLSYKFRHRRLGVRLLDDQNLAEQQVEESHILRIQPEIAGGGSRP